MPGPISDSYEGPSDEKEPLPSWALGDKCEHPNFEANVEVNRIQHGEGGPVTRYSADVRIICTKCKLPFRFIGLPAGLDLNGAAVSIDGTEARLAIAPKGEVLTPLEDTDIHGFTVRRTV